MASKLFADLVQTFFSNILSTGDGADAIQHHRSKGDLLRIRSNGFQWSRAHSCSTKPATYPKCTDNKGFTLTELLVVIAVIALLAALLIPALNKAKQSAEDIVCRNNLRQQALGLANYVGDFKVYPLGRASAQGTSNVLWMQALQGYVRDTWPTTADWSAHPNGVLPRGVYSCPSYTRAGGLYTIASGGAFGAYAYSADPGPQAVGDTGVWFLPLGDGIGGRPIPENLVLAPSDLIAIGDSEIFPAYPPMPTDPVMGLFEFPFGSPDLGLDYGTLDKDELVMLRRHGGRWNVVFCDAHVEHGKVQSFFNWSNDIVLKRWNRDNAPHRSPP